MRWCDFYLFYLFIDFYCRRYKCRYSLFYAGYLFEEENLNNADLFFPKTFTVTLK